MIIINDRNSFVTLSPYNVSSFTIDIISTTVEGFFVEDFKVDFRYNLKFNLTILSPAGDIMFKFVDLEVGDDSVKGLVDVERLSKLISEDEFTSRHLNPSGKVPHILTNDNDNGRTMIGRQIELKFTHPIIVDQNLNIPKLGMSVWELMESTLHPTNITKVEI